jgi:hypothetical protein
LGLNRFCVDRSGSPLKAYRPTFRNCLVGQAQFDREIQGTDKASWQMNHGIVKIRRRYAPTIRSYWMTRR